MKAIRFAAVYVLAWAALARSDDSRDDSNDSNDDNDSLPARYANDCPYLLGEVGGYGSAASSSSSSSSSEDDAKFGYVELISRDDDTFTVYYDLKGLAADGTSIEGLKIVNAAKCEDAASAANYYDGVIVTSDPWMDGGHYTFTYDTNSAGKASGNFDVNTGYTLANARKKIFVVMDDSGNGVGCAEFTRITNCENDDNRDDNGDDGNSNDDEDDDKNDDADDDRKRDVYIQAQAGALHDQEHTIAEQQAEIVRLNKIIDNKNDKIDRLETKIDGLQDTLRDVRSDNKALQVKNANLDHTNDHLVEENNQFADEKTNTRNRYIQMLVMTFVIATGMVLSSATLYAV